MSSKLLEQRLLSMKDLLSRVPISRSTIYLEIRAGRLKPLHIGRRVLFEPDTVEAWLAAHRGGA